MRNVVLVLTSALEDSLGGPVAVGDVIESLCGIVLSGEPLAVHPAICASFEEGSAGLFLIQRELARENLLISDRKGFFTAEAGRELTRQMVADNPWLATAAEAAVLALRD